MNIFTPAKSNHSPGRWDPNSGVFCWAATTEIEPRFPPCSIYLPLFTNHLAPKSGDKRKPIIIKSEIIEHHHNKSSQTFLNHPNSSHRSIRYQHTCSGSCTWRVPNMGYPPVIIQSSWSTNGRSWFSLVHGDDWGSPYDFRTRLMDSQMELIQ